MAVLSFCQHSPALLIIKYFYVTTKLVVDYVIDKVFTKVCLYCLVEFVFDIFIYLPHVKCKMDFTEIY